MVVSMKNFDELIVECLHEVEKAGITPGNIIEWQINRRAKTRWGLCEKRRNGDCIIQISAQLLEDDRISEEDCKATIIHEILHSCKECKGHTGKWKEYAQRMNALYGYNIKRVTTGEEKGVENYHQLTNLPIRYVFRCKYCGAIVAKKRQCKFTKQYWNYICLNCGNAHGFQKLKRD